MEFPIALEAYLQTKHGELLKERTVVLNSIEANNFLQRHLECLIKTQPLNAEELGDPRIN